jgi:hypothetical protein
LLRAPHAARARSTLPAGDIAAAAACRPQSSTAAKGAAALDAFCLHWETLTKRYQGISSEQLSFDLVNEPPAVSAEIMTRADHERVVRAMMAAIRQSDPTRRIIADGLRGSAIGTSVDEARQLLSRAKECDDIASGMQAAVSIIVG